MRIKVNGKNVVVTPALKAAVEMKLEKFDKYFKEDTEAQVTMGVQKNRQIIEITIPINGSILRVEEATEDMYSAIDKAVDKLNSQIRKHKTKLERKYRGHNHIRFEHIPAYEDSQLDAKIVKTKKFAMKPMGEEEAILQMELLGHSFYVFTNAETDDVNVIYKRKDGNYGLIEPSF
ncbi:MAG: ribosome-associated translation inhibitor RaiA [Anaeromicrobium sp.]|uniref:ribosome hibernation-promoting factor, HPF/YfiA family n=1 Tax=Anaeromicrobium sp. TaxID=1929132 RepID=UPI0025E63D51|nr:ribosome-associated translation inhibitor RaiA [Anaeromicrobium sp.]MCT4592710.1 ribosome-associated translation inhibitor RaiA [Anaeromicrobium sp.]